MPDCTDRVVAADNVAVILLLLIGRLANVVTVLTPISLFMVFLSAAAINPLVDSLATAYVVFVGTTHVPSPRRKEVCLPAAGAGTNPADPAAEDVAPPMLLYVVLGGVCHVP